jgi:hypothetical protein
MKKTMFGRGAGASTTTPAMRQRRETVEHPFDTMKVRVGTTHFGARVFVVFA